ncbi:MAG: hypothetical protein ACO2ZM_05510 [Francisellaceae bacterium]
MGTSCFTDFALAPTARRLLFTAQDYPGLLDLAFRSPCLAAKDDNVNKQLVDAGFFANRFSMGFWGIDNIPMVRAQAIRDFASQEGMLRNPSYDVLLKDENFSFQIIRAQGKIKVKPLSITSNFASTDQRVFIDTDLQEVLDGKDITISTRGGWRYVFHNFSDPTAEQQIYLPISVDSPSAKYSFNWLNVVIVDDSTIHFNELIVSANAKSMGEYKAIIKIVRDGANYTVISVLPQYSAIGQQAPPRVVKFSTDSNDGIIDYKDHLGNDYQFIYEPVDGKSTTFLYQIKTAANKIYTFEPRGYSYTTGMGFYNATIDMMTLKNILGDQGEIVNWTPFGINDRNLSNSQQNELSFRNYMFPNRVGWSNMVAGGMEGDLRLRGLIYAQQISQGYRTGIDSNQTGYQTKRYDYLNRLSTLETQSIRTDEQGQHLFKTRQLYKLPRVTCQSRQ